jgi:uncharacterized protein YdcH (DUF465 family)
MTRKQWLEKRHKELDVLAYQLESEREIDRSAEHKALLVATKKQRLAVKTELEKLKASEPVSVN